LKTLRSLKIFAVLAFLAFTFQNTYAQLGFCSGNSGDPIFIENFGTGTNIGPALPNGVTSYSFTSGTPSDGSYTIASNTNYYDWHNATDHTPGDTNGKMLIVNASYTAGEFYQTTISGLCENTSYEFSAFLLGLARTGNGCGAGLIPVNVTFQIWDDTNTNLLASGNTEDLFDTTSPIWTPYGLVFKSEPGQTSVILKMINNGTGGCGNDLAIDDIVFKSCGDVISITNDPGENIIAQCEGEGVIISTTITATPDFSIYNSHAYQWQESTDNLNWTDINSETSNTYTTPTLANSRFFRVKVAEDPINVSNPLCNVVSEVFSALVIPIPEAPISNGNVSVCVDALRPLSVTVPTDQIVNWYDAPSGGNLILENSPNFTPAAAGTYYAAASSNLTDCFSVTRTSLIYTINELPIVTDESILLCENVPITLSARVNNVTYEWSTGERTESIEIVTPGIFTMTATNSNGCTALKTIMVEQIEQPIIDVIRSNEEDIVISTINTGEFEYALNNGPFQESPVFKIVKGGLYIVNVRGKNNCPAVSEEFLHFVIPKFFTPNGDTINDSFVLEGLEFFSTVDVQIFDRYGMLVKKSSSNSFNWDGSFNGKILPSSDYWYVIKTDNQVIKGHLTLKR
jgi:gliding motility-associated-like protein